MCHGLERCELVCTITDLISSERRLTPQFLAVNAIHEDAGNFKRSLVLIDNVADQVVLCGHATIILLIVRILVIKATLSFLVEGAPQASLLQVGRVYSPLVRMVNCPLSTP